MPTTIRSASYTSSYTSGTLTVPRPPTIVPGDFLVVFLVAMGVHYGNAYWGFSPTSWHHEFGNPPAGLIATPPGGPVIPTSYPHTPPMSTLVNGAGGFDHNWFGTGADYYGNYWSNLGKRSKLGTGRTDWDNAQSTAALGLWPFIDGWWGPGAPTDPGQNPSGDPCMYSITACGRTVDGTESANFTFTLNNPLDSEYDYRGLALCVTPNDWAGDFYDNIDGGGTNAKNLTTNGLAYFTASGIREWENLSTLHYPAGTTAYLSTLDAYLAANSIGAWPVSTSNYMWLADPTTPELADPVRPRDLNGSDELILNLIAYAAPTSFGDPTGVTVADLSITPHVDPLPLLHREIWTKGSSTLMVHLSQTTATTGHATTAAGDGIVTLTQRILVDNGGSITAPYPPLLTEAPSQSTEYGLGLALTFRVRLPYVAPVLPAVPSRLATIVG